MKSSTFAVENPATREVIQEVPDMSVEEALASVGRASAAFQTWSKSPPRVRSEALRRAHDLMLRDRDHLASLISEENGKSLADAGAEVAYAAEFFRWFSEEAVRPGGDFGEAPAGGVRTLVTHRPVGVAALVTPWNFPAAMATRKIAPALAAGCTVVLKPAELTPLTSIAIARLLVEAGVPQGVVEVVTTSQPGQVVTAWMQDPRVRKVSFTGSTRVGTLLLHQAADRVLNASMELGGNAPLIITDGVDLDQAIEGAMTAKFRNGGQACTAANRLYVHEDVADSFLAGFGKRVAGLKVGPANEGSTIGPLISEAERQRITGAVETAVSQGARVHSQGHVPPAATGYFYPPTVLVDVPAEASILREEIFGPVAPVVTWRNESEMISQVNDTEFGLAAYVFSGDFGRGLRIAEQIEAGMVGVNRGLVSDPSAPFGGVKQSGLGREGAREGLREFQETQYLSLDWPTVHDQVDSARTRT